MKNPTVIAPALAFLALILACQTISADDSVKKSNQGTPLAKIIVGEQGDVSVIPLEGVSPEEGSRSGEMKRSSDSPVRTDPGTAGNLDVQQFPEGYKTHEKTPPGFKDPSDPEIRELLIEDFQGNYREFLERQKAPLTSANEELFLLDGQIWKRAFGEREYFLIPRIVDLPEYENRITRLDDRERGVCKSKSHVVNVEVTPRSMSLLSNMGIDIPDYVVDSVKVFLPQIDIDNLSRNNVRLDVRDSYGGESFDDLPIDETKASRVTIWNEGFEGSFPDTIYGVKDDNPENGEDYWDDLNCKYHGGGWSIWCADEGDQPDCDHYDLNMDAWFWKNLTLDLSEYANVEFAYWVNYETESDYDYLKEYYWQDGSWYLVATYTGDSYGWSRETRALEGFTSYGFWFRFESDGFNTYEGAYLDDMEISGDLIQTNLTTLPDSTSLIVTGTLLDIYTAVINNGTGDAGPSELGFYLSDDTFISTSDDWIGSSPVSGLAPGSFSIEDFSIDVWFLSPPGTYYVGFIIDYLDEVVESNESDNTWCFSSQPVTIPSVVNLTLLPGSDSLTVTGTQVDIFLSVFNDGTLSANPSELGYYLSEDITVDPSDDCLIGTDYIPALVPGSYEIKHASIDVTGLCSDGTYYACFYIDHLDQVEEYMEDDNTGYFDSPQVIIDSSNLPGDQDFSGSVPASFGLLQNYPNPFNPTTTINYDIPVVDGEVEVSLKIYNLRGGLVTTLVDDSKVPGRYAVHWNGRDNRGIEVPSGVYLYKIRAGDFLEIKRMVVMK